MNQQNSNRISILRDQPAAVPLVKLGIPTIIGMLISTLYNAIDAYFVSGLSTSQMGTVSVEFLTVQIAIGLGMMFGARAFSYISRTFGGEDTAEAGRAASTALFAGVFTGAAIIAGIMAFLDPVRVSLGAADTILPYARGYAQIYVTGSMVNVFTFTTNNPLTAQGAAAATVISLDVSVALYGGFIMTKQGGVKAVVPEHPAFPAVRRHLGTASG